MCRGISPTSKIGVEILTRSGHSFWAKDRQASETIDLQQLFDDYLDSTDNKFTVSSQS